MTLEFTARIAERGFDVELGVATGETLAILGPNGSGKSTLLESIVGLIRPDDGHASLDGVSLFDVGPKSTGAWVPPHRRAVSLLAQSALLFPRMSVRDNVAFGPQSTGKGRSVARGLATHWLAEVDATELTTRKPSQLSGGQAQRVAIARALASQPGLLLLDEPMAALDVTVTPSLRRLLRRVLDTQTAILVTHDVLDAWTLASRVAVMADGHIVEIGTTREVFERPRSQFTAALVGLNLVTGVRANRGLTTDGGAQFGGQGTGIPSGTRVGGTIRPAAVSISAAQPTGAGLNSVRGRVTDLEPRGDVVRVSTEQLFADVAPALVAELDLVPGVDVWCSFPAAELTLFAL